MFCSVKLAQVCIKIISVLEDNIDLQKNDNWNLVQKVFDGSYFNVLQTISAAARDSAVQTSLADEGLLDSFANKNYPLISYDKNIWMELSNRALNSSAAYINLLKTVIMAKKNTEDAVAALKKEYHLK